MKNTQNIPQVGKVTLFKPRIGKVISSQTTGGFSVITFFFHFTPSILIYFNLVFSFN